MKGERVSDPLSVSSVEAEARQLLEKITPGDWTVKYRELVHRIGSPLCLETCGEGQKPVEIRCDQQPGELHVFLTEYVEDVMAGDEHVVCFGHDYDDHGCVSAEDAEFIAAAPRLLRALLEARTPQQTKLETAVRELCEAAFDYHVHSELHSSVQGVEKTVRLLNARHAVQFLLSDPPQPSPAPPDRLMKPCPQCYGSGCARCDGTGKVIIGSPSSDRGTR